MKNSVKRTVLPWEIVGLVFIVTVGRAFHYLFGQFPTLVTSLIAPVNESAWEHVKLFFAPVLLFALLEIPFIRKVGHNLLVARVAGIFAMIVVGLTITPIHMALFPHGGALGHVLTYMLAIALGQMVSYRLLRAPVLHRGWTLLAGVALLILGVLLVFFTFWQPPVELFRDPLLDRYGMPPELYSAP